MAKLISEQNQFNGGELSPRMYARTDLAPYANSLETMTNMKPVKHGPAIKRNGTKYVSHVKDSSKEVRLIRFQFAKDDGVIIEAGDGYFRFYASSGQVKDSSQNITGLTQANPGVVTITGHNYENGDQVYIESVVGMTEVNDSNIPYIVANKTANTFELTDIDGNNVNTTSFTAYSSGGTATRIHTLTTPWDDTEVQDLSYAQFGDLMYFAHPSYEPRVLTRTSNTSWRLRTLEADPPPTYEKGHYFASTTLTPAATTGTAVNFTASTAMFTDSMVGRQIVNEADGETGRAVITSKTSTTVVVCDIIEDFTDTNAIAGGDWLVDGSPICDLEWEGTALGETVDVTAKFRAGTYDDTVAITGITNANPAVVTTSAAHGFVDGDEVQIRAVQGMTEVNGNTYRINQLTSTTFELIDADSTNFLTYASGGTARLDWREDTLACFDTSQDAGKYIFINGGILKILATTSTSSARCQVVKSLDSDDRSGNWSLETETWDSTRGWPRAVGLYQERLIFGGTTAQPQTIWMSEIGIFNGFGTGTSDASAIEQILSSGQVNTINWIGSSRDVILGTSGGEITINGGTSGAAITPANVSAIPRTYHGSQRQQPVSVGDELLFLQASARKVRTFRYDFNIDNYRGEDLTTLAEHITAGGIKEIAHSQEPDNIIHCVTNNGDLLSCAYERFQEILGWSKYDFNGTVENVQTISEGEEDQVWVVIKRTINGNTRRYVEYFDSSDGSEDDHVFSDSTLTFSTGYAITNISLANPAVVTTSSAHGYSNGDKVIIKDLVDPDAADLDSTKTNISDLNGCTFTVANVTSTTFELSGKDTSGYNAYSSGGNVYLKGTSLTGLDHLEGETVQIKVDGAAHANKTVSSGAITLDEAAGEVTVGLAYTITLKTLRKEYNIGPGSMQGQRTRHIKPIVRVYNSTLPTLNGQDQPTVSGSQKMGKKTELYSGDLVYAPTGWDNKGQITLTDTSPFPLQIQGIFGTIEGGIR